MGVGLHYLFHKDGSSVLVRDGCFEDRARTGTVHFLKFLESSIKLCNTVCLVNKGKTIYTSYKVIDMNIQVDFCFASHS